LELAVDANVEILRLQVRDLLAILIGYDSVDLDQVCGDPNYIIFLGLGFLRLRRRLDLLTDCREKDDNEETQGQ
jgi:hypothetical protein